MTDADLRPLDTRTIALDCRFLGLGGPGRVTESLLEGLAELEPPGRWLLWGNRRLLQRYTWPGAEIRHTRIPAKLAFGQASCFACPRADVAVFLHHWRPLFIRSRSITLIHDTIPLHFARSTPRRLLQSAFYRLARQQSHLVLTVSQRARQALVEELGIEPDKIHVIPMALTSKLVPRILEEQAHLEPGTELVYTGRFVAHKNLRRLARAFDDAGLANEGYVLRLIGGTSAEIAALAAWLKRQQLQAGITLTGYVTDEALAGYLARARAVVAVSLEEGFGLPAFEAAAAGIPVLATRTGAMDEIPASNAIFVDPRNTTSIAQGLRAVLALPAPTPWRGHHSPRDQALSLCIGIAAALTTHK